VTFYPITQLVGIILFIIHNQKLNPNKTFTLRVVFFFPAILMYLQFSVKLSASQS